MSIFSRRWRRSRRHPAEASPNDAAAVAASTDAVDGSPEAPALAPAPLAEPAPFDDPAQAATTVSDQEAADVATVVFDVAPSEPAPAVSCNGIVKCYGEGDAAVMALRGVTAQFATGSFTAIMGPSGSGKSTLMHILAGLDTPTEGTVEIAGQRLDELNDRELTRLRRDSVGFVFQAFNLLPVLTAEENIVLPLTIAGKKPDPYLLQRLLQTFDLADRRDHRPSELSGGQQQRTAIARALITRPSVVFADEPTGNLDSASSEEVLDTLRRAVDEFGQTIVMVTHDSVAAAQADRILFLDDGRIVRDSPRLTAAAILDVLKVR